MTTFENTDEQADEDAVTKNVTTGTFSERILREILDLTPSQQLELVQALADPDENEVATSIVSTFTEGLLRNILDLSPVKPILFFLCFVIDHRIFPYIGYHVIATVTTGNIFLIHSHGITKYECYDYSKHPYRS